MARPQKQTVDYFPHMAAASAGDTLTVLESKFGNDGYAFWFKLLERLSAADGHYLDCRNLMKWQTLLAKAHVSQETGEAIIVLLLEMEAIDKELWESRVIWCQNLVDNLADVYKNRKRPVPQKPVPTPNNGISTPNNTFLQGVSTPDNPQTKLKETKLKETKVEKENNIKEKLSLLSDKQEVELEKDIYSLYTDEIGKRTPLIDAELRNANEQFGEEWVRMAIKEASKQQHRSMAYIQGILKNMAKNGGPAKEEFKLPVKGGVTNRNTQELEAKRPGLKTHNTIEEIQAELLKRAQLKTREGG